MQLVTTPERVFMGIFYIQGASRASDFFLILPPPCNLIKMKPAIVLLLSLAAATNTRVSVDWVGASWWPDCREYAKFVWPLLQASDNETAVDFNSIINFAFYPNQADTLAACTNNNTNPESSYLCKIDHFEACTISNLGCIGGCDDDKKQRQLFQFLYCFEGLHVKALPNKDWPGPSWLNAMEPCAVKAGLDYATISKCASDVSQGSELSNTFEAITKYVKSQHLQYFPWVTLDNKQMGNVCDTCLESWVCGNYTGSPKPASCSAKRPQEC